MLPDRGAYPGQLQAPGRDLIQVQLALVPLLVAAIVATQGKVGYGTMLAVASTALLFNLAGLWRSVKHLGGRADVGIMLLQFACLFWFFGPGFGTALSEHQFRKIAVDINITNEHGILGYVAVSGFYFALSLSYYASRGSKLAVRVVRVLRSGPTARSHRVVPYLVIASGIALTFYIVASGGIGKMLANFAGSRIVKTPWDSAGNYGTSLSALHFLFSSVLTVCSAMAGYYAMSGEVRGGRRVLLGFVAVVAMAAVTVESGTRSVLALCVIPPAIALYRRSRVQGSRTRRKLPVVLLLGGLALGALAMANFQLKHRLGMAQGGVDVSIHSSDFMTNAAFSMHVVDLERSYTYDSPALHVLTGPVPRVLWSGKPESKAMVVFTKYMWGQDITKTGGNNLPSIVGQYYIAWSWFGVFEIGFWLGLFVAIGDRAVRRMHPDSPAVVAYGMTLAYFFVSFRLIGFVYFTPVPLAWIFARHLSRRLEVAKGPDAADQPRPGTGPEMTHGTVGRAVPRLAQGTRPLTRRPSSRS